MTGGLNGGVRFDLVFRFVFKFHVPGPMEICQKRKIQSNSMATWPQGVHDILTHFVPGRPGTGANVPGQRDTETRKFAFNTY